MLADGTELLVHVATVKEGLPVGQFALWPSAMVSRGPLRQMLDQLPVQSRHLDRLGAVAVATGAIGPDRKLSYPVLTPTPAASIDGVATLVACEFVPFLSGFAGDWAAGFQFTLQWPEFVARPFSTAAILAHLGGDDHVRPRLEEATAAAAGDQRFWDLREARDPTALMARIEMLATEYLTGCRCVD